MTKSLKTIILAAGKGVRMKSDLPKVLHPVCGRPMIRYVTDLAKSVGSLKTFVVLGHQHDVIKTQLDKSVTVAIQKKLIGTADAIKSVRHHFQNDHGNVLVLCGDAPLLTRETIRVLLAKHKSSKAVCTFLTATVHCPCGYGRVVRNSEGQVIAIREELDATDEEKTIKEINSGVYCFQSRELFQAISTVGINSKKREFYLTDLISLFKDRGLSVETATTRDGHEALGINTRADLALAQTILRKRILKNLMLNGVTIEDPETTYVDADVTIGRDTVIRSHTVIENDVRIGNRCMIGPFSHIRPGCIIDDDVQLGNFSEVSRSTVGQGTWMRHFSFLGDSRVGKNVNIGAGVVTANFDGKNKNRTIISDQAFIGSDSILVAPVVIGKKSITGAGCVVTKNSKVPNGAVAVGVPAKIKLRRKTK